MDWSAFAAEWGIAIAIALAVLAIEALAEWKDHRDGLYDDDEPGEWDDGHPDVYIITTPDRDPYDDVDDLDDVWADDEHPQIRL